LIEKTRTPLLLDQTGPANAGLEAPLLETNP
jgi:hypothetical protein